MPQSEQMMPRRLEWPDHPVDVVLDTDAFNEIDDQYAIAYMVRSQDKLNIRAICAAPFLNEKVESPEQGMEKSFAEIHNILGLMDAGALSERVHRGAPTFLPDENNPVDSPAAREMIRLARQHTPDTPLYLMGIAAITDIASAILMAPDIVERVVVVWLGGNATHWSDTREFNMIQDIAAARVVLSSGAPLVLLPCMGVVSAFRLSGADIAFGLKGKNRLCDYLAEVTEKEAQKTAGSGIWSRAIWDVTAVAWLCDREFVRDRLERYPLPNYDGTFSGKTTAYPVRYVYHIQRDALMRDLLDKLTTCP